MFKEFLKWFIIIAILLGIVLYIYGQKLMFGMTSTSTENYVDKTLENPSVNHWIPYEPPSKKFSSKFPSPPQHATDRSLDAKTKEPKQYEMYISENNGKVFMISVISFLKGDKSLEGESVLKAVVDDMVASNPGNKLDKIQFGSNDGYKDVDFQITNSAYAINGRAFFAENHLYVLSALSKTPQESQDEFAYFIKSFKLNKSPIPDVPTGND